MGPKQRAAAGRFESGLVERDRGDAGARGRRRELDSEDSSISFFQGNDLSSVDDVDLVAGRLATVFALLGAEGSFGVKGSADRLLPDLLGAAPQP